MADFWLKCVAVYFMIGTIFLMLFITGRLKLEMYSRKDRKTTEGRGNLHILLLPVVAIISIYVSKRQKE